MKIKYVPLLMLAVIVMSGCDTSPNDANNSEIVADSVIADNNVSCLGLNQTKEGSVLINLFDENSSGFVIELELDGTDESTLSLSTDVNKSILCDEKCILYTKVSCDYISDIQAKCHLDDEEKSTNIYFSTEASVKISVITFMQYAATAEAEIIESMPYCAVSSYWTGVSSDIYYLNYLRK